MTKPQIHLRQLAADTYLRQLAADTYRRNTLCACGAIVANWTDDAQAVTCPRCISQIELQPA